MTRRIARRTRAPLLGGLTAALVPAAAMAEDLSAGDTAWMLTATALVLFMTIPGLSLFYAGMVRSKNVLSVLMQCFAITGLMSILWAFWGYSIAFDDGNAFMGGFGKLFLAGVTVDAMSGTIPETVFMTFQMTFAVITPALIVGAFAERMKFSAMLWFMGIWMTVVYAPITHWVWGGGWLGDRGILDFAGGTVVHINAGIAGLAACLVLGKRKGYPTIPMPPNNLGYTIVGAAMLWVGWFGFNAGSELAADGVAGMALTVTQLATAAAALHELWMRLPAWSSNAARPMVTGMSHGKFHRRCTHAPWRMPNVSAADTASVIATATRVRRSISPAISAGTSSKRSHGGTSSSSVANRHWRARNSPNPKLI